MTVSRKYSNKALEVFDLPELLGHVILQLPTRDILTSASRISRTWKACIDESPTIQERLFLKSSKAVAKPCRIIRDNDGKIPTAPVYSKVLKVNPFLAPESSGDEKRSRTKDVPWIFRDRIEADKPPAGIKSLQIGASTPLFQELKWRHQSLYDMYITDPACSMVSVTVMYSDNEGVRPVEFFVKDPEGIKLRVLMCLREETWKITMDEERFRNREITQTITATFAFPSTACATLSQHSEST